MTGTEFLKIQEQKIFRPAVMNAIINEFVPPEKSFLYTDAFMPMKDSKLDEIVSLIKAGAFGKTNPVYLSGEHARIDMPTHFYREHAAGYWREAMMFDEKTLLKVRQPDKPDQLWGEGLIGEAMNVMDLRLNTLIEYLSSQVVLNNGYSVAKAGVSYSYTSPLSTRYFLKMTSDGVSGFKSAPWISSPHASQNEWDALTTSKPLLDIREGAKLFADYGFQATELWMTRTVGGYIEDNTTSGQTSTLISANPALAGQMLTAELLITAVSGLKGLKVVVDDRRYLEESAIVRPLAAGSGGTIYVNSTDGMAVGDTVTLRDTENSYEEDVALTAVDASARTLTFTVTISNAYPVGGRVTASKKFSDDTKVVFRGAQNQRVSYANWVSTPSLIKGKDWKNPQAGRYTWSTFNDRVPYWIEVGSGIHGGPMIYSGGGWLTLKVA